MSSTDVVLWALFVCVNFGIVLSDKVPVLIWSNDRSISVPQPLAGHTLGHDDFSRQYLDTVTTRDNLNMVVFIQDKISLDDITRGAAIYSHKEDEDVFSQIKAIMSSLSVAQLPSVSSPTVAIADLKKHFEQASVYLLRDPYHISDLALDSKGHQLVLVQLPATAPTGGPAYQQSLRAIDEIVGSVTAQFKSLSTPFIALYTAISSSSKPSMSPHRSGRQLLETAGDQTTAMPPMSKLMANVSEQFFLYTDSIVLNINKSGVFNLSTSSWSVIDDLTDCPSNNSLACIVELSYDETIAQLPNLHMKFVTNKTTFSNAGYWFLEEFEVSYGPAGGERERFQLNPSFVDQTPFNFSYHCQEPPTIQSINASETSVEVKFGNFQIQAYDFKGDKFGYYNDCIGFFTIPIWMGLISSIVMLTILLFGVFMLLDIKTMDRYDDPKGKTISITATD